MNHRIRVFLALWCIFAGSVGSPQPCAAEAIVTLRTETEIKGTTVRLSDVFKGVPSEIDREIAQAPAPGKQVVYDIEVLKRLADKYRLDWQAQSVDDHTTITTACTRITADMIRDAVIEKVKMAEGTGLHADGDVEVTFDNHALEVDLPTDQMPRFTLNNFNFDPMTKHFYSDLVADTAKGPFSVPVTGKFIVKRNVPVLTHRLEGGTVVGAADIDMILLPEEKLNPSILTDAHQLIGHELRRDTDPGEVLHAHDIIPPRYVTRGGLVTMKIETPLMQITTQGKSLQDGSEGDVVRVMNTQSNRMVEGIVSGPGVVLVHTAPQPVMLQQAAAQAGELRHAE